MRKGFYVNIDDCVGCRACQIACKDAMNLDVGVLFRKVTSYEAGHYPEARVYHLATTCNHCEKPMCVEACPISAMYIDEEDGTVQHDDSLCIGCKACENACPYGVPHVNPETNLSEKCYACKTFRDKGEDPACVAACPMHALEFGDIEELRASHPDAVDKVAPLPDSSLTIPSLLMNPKPVALDDDFRVVVI